MYKRSEGHRSDNRDLQVMRKQEIKCINRFIFGVMAGHRHRDSVWVEFGIKKIHKALKTDRQQI